jgi:hypothetical protein
LRKKRGAAAGEYRLTPIGLHPRPLLQSVFSPSAGVPKNPALQSREDAKILEHRNPDQIAPQKSGYSVFVLMKGSL